MPGTVLVQVVKSEGVNATATDARLDKPIKSVATSYILSGAQETFKTGGHVEG
jgi:hypothetical protein